MEDMHTENYQLEVPRSVTVTQLNYIEAVDEVAADGVVAAVIKSAIVFF